MAFVLPRAFFSADHHDNSRSGIAKGFRLIDIWDLTDVSPLFRIPSCVFFSEKANSARKIKASGLGGKQFSGRLPAHNCQYEIAKDKLTEKNVIWYYAKQGKATAFSIRKSSAQKKENPYKNRFKQGATIVPRAFYFVDLNQDVPDDFNNRVINIKTSDSVKVDAKAPWKGIEYSARIEGKFLFRTALTKSILPFALHKPILVTLPIEITLDSASRKKTQLFKSDELMNKGYLYASKWFLNAERIWDINKTEKAKNMSNVDRIDFQRGLSEQNLNAKYLVLYNSSAKDANSLVINRANLVLEFFVESVAYVCYSNNENEAYYLSAILNSKAPNELMKDFQAKGLFGARHVHKKILDIYFPLYSASDELHNQLADLSKKCHEKAVKYLDLNSPPEVLTTHELGKLRVEIKKYLLKEMEDIDKLVKKVMKQ